MKMPRAQAIGWGIALKLLCALAVLPAGALHAMPPVDIQETLKGDALPPLPTMDLERSAVSGPLYIDFSNDNIAGEGVDWLRQAIENASIFAVGDEPGMVEGARVLDALLPVFDRVGYRAYALEVGPWMAANIEDITRRGGDEIARYLRDEANARQMQVINFKEEATLAQNAIRYWSDWPRVLWGLDQEFLTSAPFLLDRLSLFAGTPDQRNAIAHYRAQAGEDPFYLASASDSVFEHLRSLFPKSAEEPQALIEEMALSKHIYGPFLENSERLQKAFVRREALLWNNFLRFWRETLDRMGQAPRVLVKTSAAHMHSEVTPTGIPSFGHALQDFAASRKRAVFSIAVICGPGGSIRRADGGVKSCDAGFRSKYASLARYLPADGRAVLLPQDVVAGVISGFDAYLIVPNATSAHPAWEAEQALAK